MGVFLRQTVFWVTCVFALWLAVLPSLAQTGNSPDYQQWQIVSQRAERAVEADRASDAVFETVRAELARYRQQFQDASRANADRIERLQSQLSALGPLPEDGNEAPEIAARRAELNRLLQDASAPVVTAEEAFTEADGLIREIDALLDGRRTANLTARAGSPLNPAVWPSAFAKLEQAAVAMIAEIRRALIDPDQRADIWNNLLIFVVLFSIGSLFIARGRRWTLRVVEYLRSLGGRGIGVSSFVFSLGRIVLPVAGIYVITEAIFVTGIVGLRGERLVENLPEWGLVLLVLRWLCERLFSRNEHDALLTFTAERRAELRLYGTVLAFLYVGNDILFTMMDVANGSNMDRVVVGYPVLVMCAVVLFRLGLILSRGPISEGDSEDGDATTFVRILRIIGRISIVVAVSTPVISALGFTALAPAILFPTVKSLALFGLAMVLQHFFSEVYALVSGRGEEAHDSAVPVLIGFAMALATLPLLALIWGARPGEIQEAWQTFNEGFALGETRISPTAFLTFAVIFAALYMLTRLFQSTLKTSLLPKTNLDSGGQNAIVSGVGYVGIFLAALVAITSAGIDLSGLAIVAGALSVGIGFGLQTIVQNFVSGIILLIERPIAEGDWIEVNGNMGYVRDISVRSTRIETFDRTDVIVPNADFVSGTVTNYTRGNTIGRVIVPVGVAYGTDTRMVEKILREIAEGHPMIIAVPPPNVFFRGFGESSLDFEIRGILRDVNWIMSVRSELNHQIAKRFVEEGIEIPFAQRDLWLRNPEVLPGAESFAGSLSDDVAREETPPAGGETDSPEDRDDKS